MLQSVSDIFIQKETIFIFAICEVISNSMIAWHLQPLWSGGFFASNNMKKQNEWIKEGVMIQRLSKNMFSKVVFIKIGSFYRRFRKMTFWKLPPAFDSAQHAVYQFYGCSRMQPNFLDKLESTSGKIRVVCSLKGTQCRALRHLNFAE